MEGELSSLSKDPEDLVELISKHSSHSSELEKEELSGDSCDGGDSVFTSSRL